MHIRMHTHTHIHTYKAEKKDKLTNDKSLGTVPEGPDDYQEITEG